MVVLYILIIAIMCLVELCCIYYFSSGCSSVKLEVGFIGDVPTAIIHRNCFFLPLTAKKIEYKNLKKASFVEKERRNKYSKYMEYDVILNFPNPDDIFVLFRDQSSKDFVLKICNRINESIASFKSCSVGEYSMKSNIVNILLAFLMSIFMFAALMPLIYQPEIYKIHKIEASQYVFLCLISILVTTVFIITSFIVNIFKKSKNNNVLITDYVYNNKEDINISSEADKINDSIIK